MRRRLSEFLRQGLRPSLGDVLLAVLIGRLFVAGRGWSVLLADGDTGWHIRAGDWILASRRVPTTDLFSFSRSGEAWFAWEWLSDVLMALLHRYWGIAGVAVLAGCVIALAAMILFRHMLWRGANAVVAFPVLLVALGASSIHYLARPHLSTLLLMTVSLWMVEYDRRSPGPAVWLLAPLSAVWINLHAGFFALPVTLAALAAGLGVEAWLDRPQRSVKWAASRRYLGLAAATLAASLLNPYGIGLHRHVAHYLTSDWIRNSISEFQSPSFRSENLQQFELLLMAALLLAGALLIRKCVADALLVVLWTHMALGSVRHVPIYAVVSAPLVAVEITRLWQKWVENRPARSAGRILWTLGTDMAPSFRRFSLWAPVLATAVMLLTPTSQWPGDFPESSFPVSLVRSEASRLAGARVFTSDQWADYLIYHGWPRQRVFFDGRSDFYGPTIGEEYLTLIRGRPGWERLLQKYAISLVLVPIEWPLSSLLDRDPAWRRLREDQLGVLFERSDPRASPKPGPI